MDDDGVRPVDDVVVERRLAPVDGGAGVAALGANLVEAGYEVRVMRSIWERGSDALSFRTRHLVAARTEYIEPEVREHADVVIFGNGVTSQEDDIHFAPHVR